LGFETAWAPDHLLLGRDGRRRSGLTAESRETHHALAGCTDIESATQSFVAALEDHCDTVGRDPDDVAYSWDGHVICTRDQEKLDAYMDLMSRFLIVSRTVESALLHTYNS
jgi:alkanesulfonate monooxygenase SsuD/methylene tetrahydromethanopterin reductase-like flavin-dependent oxidoreductase (luciferase family)